MNNTFSITILGSNAAIPGKDSITSAQLITIRDHLYLMDCGEGTQMKLQKYHIKRNKIEAIFISHLHGDHLFGLPGLLTSYTHFQRKLPLKIIGPTGLKLFVETVINLSHAFIDFDIEITELDTDACISVYQDNQVEVYAFPLNHRILTYGYKYVERISKRNIQPEMIGKYGLTYEQIKGIKSGLDVVLTDGMILKNEELIIPLLPPRSYAYCSDTMFDRTILPNIESVDVLYHETTYLDDMALKAVERKHSTPSDAATIAYEAKAGALILGHFSTRYERTHAFLEQACRIFPNV
ncbi:MAG: ribonuclease Z, partial [Saprospiraceae bacterium]|nr:ribonuclease Z [Saprospiraceae bacterium]